jgi:hypothetical protein
VKKTLTLLSAAALASCATPKAVVVAPPPKKNVEKVAAPLSESPAPALTDDRLRLGDDILALPSDDQLRSTAPTQKSGAASIITSLPSD